MTLDAEYECDNETNLYQAADDVRTLLNSTYNMDTQINTENSTTLGEGYQIKGET